MALEILKNGCSDFATLFDNIFKQQLAGKQQSLQAKFLSFKKTYVT